MPRSPEVTNESTACIVPSDTYPRPFWSTRRAPESAWALHSTQFTSKLAIFTKHPPKQDISAHAALSRGNQRVNCVHCSFWHIPTSFLINPPCARVSLSSPQHPINHIFICATRFFRTKSTLPSCTNAAPCQTTRIRVGLDGIESLRYCLLNLDRYNLRNIVWNTKNSGRSLLPG